jgi:MYXO-CTERM domain-containing protein
MRIGLGLSRIIVTVGAVAALALASCVRHDEPEGATSQGRALAEQAQMAGNVPTAPPAIAKDRFLTWVGKKPILPKWKTAWERDLERRFKEAKEKGLPNADQYDTYRTTNIAKFSITKEPASAFRTPAEFEQSQTYLLTWPDGISAGEDAMYSGMVKAALGSLPVTLAYIDAAHKTSLENKLKAAGVAAADLADPSKVIWWQHSFDSQWARDFGPLGIASVVTAGNPKLSFVDFRYYHPRIHDDEIPSDLAKAWGINVFRPDLDFEGGNFMNTGDGLCAATKGVLWYNLQFSQSAIEDIFTKYLACKKTIFPQPLNGEETTHIDMFSKFLSATKVIVGEYTATQDATNKAILDADANLFATTPNGAGATVSALRIPMPNKGSQGGYTVWRTYTNSQALNAGTKKTMLVPVYSDETTQEAAALNVYKNNLTGWDVVGIDSKAMIPYGGAFHCVVMQIPAGDKAKMETDPADKCGAKVACAVASCGNINAIGCCDGEILKYCSNGKPVAEDCGPSPKCGWNTAGPYYACGTAGGADPSGKNVKSCGVLTDAPLPDLGPDKGTPPSKCGKVTTEGCCDNQMLYYCDNGQLANIDCTQSPKCGWDPQNNYYDCGTAGAADPSGKNPQPCSGFFGDAGPPKIPDKGAPQPCGAVSNEGCCDGDLLKYCDNGTLKTLDCAQNPKCGWDPNNKYYDCGTNGAGDPSGTHPIKCGASTGDGSVPKKDTTVQQDKGTTPTPDKPVIILDTAPPAADTSTTSPDKGAPAKKDTGTTGTKPDDGCSCSVRATPASASPAPLALLLLGIGLALVRRRRP